MRADTQLIGFAGAGILFDELRRQRREWNDWNDDAEEL